MLETLRMMSTLALTPGSMLRARRMSSRVSAMLQMSVAPGPHGTIVRSASMIADLWMAFSPGGQSMMTRS